MVRKLTLSADEEIIARAKRLAAERNTSVSAMFDRFVRSIGEPEKKRRVGRLTQKVTGIAKLPRGKTERQVLEDALLEKYGIND